MAIQGHLSNVIYFDVIQKPLSDYSIIFWYQSKARMRLLSVGNQYYFLNSNVGPPLHRFSGGLKGRKSRVRIHHSFRFLNALEVGPGYLAHTRTGTGVPQNILIAKKNNNKITLKFSVCTHIISGSGLVWVSPRNFRTTFREAGVLMWVQFLECPPPAFREGKKRRNFVAISDDFWLWSRISPEQIDMSKIGKVIDQRQSHPRSAKISWTLDHKRKKI